MRCDERWFDSDTCGENIALPNTLIVCFTQIEIFHALYVLVDFFENNQQYKIAISVNPLFGVS